MKMRSVKHNNRKKAFEIKASNRMLLFPYSKLDLQPRADDPIDRVYVDNDQLLSLLHILDCDVDLVVRARTPKRGKAA